MDEFKAQKCEVQWHVKSDYSEEMASKSRVVCVAIEYPVYSCLCCLSIIKNSSVYRCHLDWFSRMKQS